MFINLYDLLILLNVSKMIIFVDHPVTQSQMVKEQMMIWLLQAVKKIIL